MSYREQMLNRLQAFQRKSEVFKAIFEAESTQFSNRELTIRDMHLQLSIDTATWGLSIYESELGIPIDLHKSYSERRSVIKSRMRGTGKIDATLIKLVADSWTNGDVDVVFDGFIKVTFNSIYGVPEGINDLMEELRNIIPAHLRIEFDFRFFLYKNITDLNLGYDDISNFTYEELLNGGLD